MTLTTRLTAFFLAGLAVTLAGYSLAVYFLVREGLYAEADARLNSTLDTLTAAAEIDSRGVEWEPGERQLSIGRGPGGGAVWWAVTGVDDHLLDGVKFPEATPSAFDANRANRNRPFTQSDATRGAWRVYRKRIETDPSRVAHAQEVGEHSGNSVRHPHLDLTAAVPLAPIHAILTRLAIILASVSSVAWFLALAGSRWVCRRALRPVATMANHAREMSAADLGERLPVPAPRDELAALGTSFNGLLDRVEEAYQRQQRFAGDASHQLRTPLAGLLGQVEVCLRHPRSVEEYCETLEKVHGRGEHLRIIVESLLFLTRADADALPASLVAVDLAEWSIAYSAGYANHQRVSDLDWQAVDGPHYAKIHPALFAQLLDNLLDNAFKYSPVGSPVRVSIKSEGSSVILSVVDRGSGIEASDLPHLFEPFFRSDASRRGGLAGVGLGLAIARRIAAAISSMIRATSEPGRGSRFEVVLPRQTFASKGLAVHDGQHER